MPQPKQRAPKAYKNVDFLNSPDARTIRILAEFLEPLRRFRKSHIRDTIVFFGSARTKPRSEALRVLRTLRRHTKEAKKPSAKLRQQIRAATAELHMSRYYEDATELARLLTLWSKTLNEQNRFIVCSGGGPGIMEAANRGAALAKGKSIGLNISLPFEQSSNSYISDELNFEFHYFFMRKFWFVYLAKALILFPGGFGTLDELMEVLTLLQTRKIKKKLSVVLYAREYWEKIIDFQTMVKLGVITADDLKLFTYADTPMEAYKYLVKELRTNYPNETTLLVSEA